MSKHLGDYAEDYADLNVKFTTVDTGGVPFTLAGTPVISCYKSNGTTQSTAGITLTVDFDSLTGLHNVKVDLSADAFYVTGEDYSLIVTTGTVDSVSVVGYEVASFSIENRLLSTKVPNVLNTTATGNIGIDWANVENPTTANDLSGTDIQLVDTTTTNTDMRGTDSALLASSAPTNFGDLSIEVSTGIVSADMQEINSVSASAVNLEQGAFALQRGAAIAGTLSTTEMTTDLSEATDDHFNGRVITWTSGALSKQSTDITDYTGSTKKLTFTAVTEAPSATDTFVIS